MINDHSDKCLQLFSAVFGMFSAQRSTPVAHAVFQPDSSELFFGLVRGLRAEWEKRSSGNDFPRRTAPFHQLMEGLVVGPVKESSSRIGKMGAFLAWMLSVLCVPAATVFNEPLLGTEGLLLVRRGNFLIAAVGQEQVSLVGIF